jgi:NDP-sugar pyrophosphorylase family protein
MLAKCLSVPGRKSMHPSQLFSISVEQQFDEWLSRFSNIEELFASRHQLYSKLVRQEIEGIVDDYVTIEGAVHVTAGAHVRSGAVLKGPLIVGPYSVIDYGAKILGEVFIGSGCRVSAGSVVSGCILIQDCVVGENCVIHNSFIGCGVIAGPGCLVGDQSTAPDGVGTYFGDGSALGAGCIVSAGSVISQHHRVVPGTVISGDKFSQSQTSQVKP